MTVAETLLVFVGIPLAIVVVLALLIFLPGGRKRVRYKPGQPWNHPPVWYEPHPEHGGSEGHELAHGAAAAVPGRSSVALGSSMYPEQAEERNTDTSRESAPHGAGGHGASTAHRPVNAGPLGGARGTW